jgi:hypothetical protein
MKLVEIADLVKKSGLFVVLTILILYTVSEVWPMLSASIAPPRPETSPVVYRFPPISFNVSPQLSLNTQGGIDVSQANIFYRRNATEDWNNLPTKRVRVYEYRNVAFEDLDYSATAKSIANFIGYSDTDQISAGDFSDDYIWRKNNISFAINKKSKEMRQALPEGGFELYKNFFTVGNFIQPNIYNSKITELLNVSRRFNTQEISTSLYEPTFLRFDGNNLLESENTGAEIAYIKIFNTIDNLKIVNKNYEIPNSFVFLGGLREGLPEEFKNIGYTIFKISRIYTANPFEEELFELIPIPAVVNDILNNKNFVISNLTFSNAPFGTPLPQDISINSISLESFELAYYNFDENLRVENTYLQPIYIFRGNFDSDKGRGEITIYTRALNPKYYN